jgi:hypothetical protein
MAPLQNKESPEAVASGLVESNRKYLVQRPRSRIDPMTTTTRAPSVALPFLAIE